jgi:hypothetical protein
MHLAGQALAQPGDGQPVAGFVDQF